MSIYDRWHKTHPAPGDQSCREHGKGRTRLYPTVSHGTGDRWQVRWRDENGQQRKRNFARRDGTDPDSTPQHSTRKSSANSTPAHHLTSKPGN